MKSLLIVALTAIVFCGSSFAETVLRDAWSLEVTLKAFEGDKFVVRPEYYKGVDGVMKYKFDVETIDGKPHFVAYSKGESLDKIKHELLVTIKPPKGKTLYQVEPVIKPSAFKFEQLEGQCKWHAPIPDSLKEDVVFFYKMKAMLKE